PISSGVLHFTPAQAAGLYVAGGNPLLLALRRPEGGVLEAQGLKDLLGAVYIQRLPRDPMHYLAQGDKVDVAVMELGARRPDGLVGGNDRQRPFITRPAVVGIHFGPQTGGVGQELPDG